jgi:hypothetical protein
MNTALFQILQIIQLKVISYLDTDRLPFLENKFIFWPYSLGILKKYLRM